MIEKEELLSIIPHRGKMLLLSRVNSYDLAERIIETEYDITDKCLFYDSELAGVPAWTGFEFIAQTIGAFSGIRDKINNEPIKFGFILAVSRVQIDLPFFKPGSIIKIRVKEIEDLSPVYVFDGEIFLDNKKVMGGKLTVLHVVEEQAEALKKEYAKNK